MWESITFEQRKLPIPPQLRLHIVLSYFRHQRREPLAAYYLIQPQNVGGTFLPKLNYSQHHGRQNRPRGNLK